MATRVITVYVRHYSRLYWILVDIAGHCQKVFLRIDQDRSVSSSKERTVPLVGSVELLGVYPIEMSHSPRQPTLRCL